MAQTQMLADPDTVKYPPGQTPKLILSVSDEVLELHAGLDAPVDLYVERFHVSQDLATHNRDDKHPIRFGLFTHEFRTIVEEDDTPRLTLSISGADGNGREKKPAMKTTVAERPEGWKGGYLEFHAEDIDQRSIKTVLFKASGGCGFSPEHQKGVEDDVVGGDSGDAGEIRVVCGSPAAAAVRRAKKIYKDCEGRKIAWPTAFKAPIEELGHLIPTTSDILDQQDISRRISSLKTALAGSKGDFKALFEDFLMALMNVDKFLASSLTQAVESNGGEPGMGPTGKKGQRGQDTTPIVMGTSTANEVWNIPICFIHPVQCRMLLNKAKEYFYVDTDDSLAKSQEILKRLGQRLAFLNQVSAKKSLGKPLTKAYQDNALRLYLPPTPANQEPEALTQLRAIKDEAASVLHLLMLNKDFYGNDRYYVPRQSYLSYKDTAVEMLEHLKQTEEKYLAYKEAATQAKATTDYIQNGKNASEAAKSYNLRLAKEATEDLKDYGMKIVSLTPTMKSASEEVLRLVKVVEDEIKSVFKVDFQELVEAMGQILMVHGAPPMVALQGASLIKKANSTISSDDGTRVKKEYLISKVKKVEGTIDSVHEGYKISKENGKVNLLDPGAAKLQITQSDLNTLLESYQESLGSERLGALKKAFESYMAIVLERNNAVLSYNAAVALLAKYKSENDAHDATIQSLGHLELSTLDLNSPLMEVVMGKIYVDMLLNTQQWLYKAQRAYNFATPNMDNVIGTFLSKTTLSQYNHELLSDAQRELDGAYQLGRDAAGDARQPFPTIRVDLDDDYVQAIKESKDGKLLTVRLSPPRSGKDKSDDDDDDDDDGILPDLNTQVEAKDFIGMADIRLTKVRFFLTGAKTEASVDKKGDKHTLHVTLTHMGDEVLTTTSAASFKFTHAALKVGFKYILEDETYTGPGTLPGIIGSETERDGYALVGPFATWLINIKKEYNSGLDLSGVKEARMEFEGEYRPT